MTSSEIVKPESMNVATDRLTEPEPVSRGLTWRRLVFFAGVLAIVAMGAVSLVIGDLEGGVVTVGFALATWLTRVRRRTLGAIGIALVSAITLYFMLTAAVTNIRAGSAMSWVLVSAGLTAVALLGLVAALGFLTHRDSPFTTAPWAGVISSTLVLIGLAAWGASTARAETEAADIRLVAKNVAFSETEIATTAGEVTVTLENQDLFWHTFSIEELGVDLRVPVGAELPVTFEAPPGEWEFICAIPGHPEAGMRGTLMVEE